MKRNKYGTKVLKEMPIECQEVLTKEFMKCWNKYDRINLASIKNKHILVFDLFPLANYLSLENDIVYISTSEKLTNEFKLKHLSPAYTIALVSNEQLEKDLDKIIKRNSMDYIIANPPYNRDLYLDIAETLLPYVVDKNGTLNMLGPILWATMPCGHEFRDKHQNLYDRLISLEIVDPETYKNFESFLGITRLGVMRFSKNKQNDNTELWKKYEDKDTIKLIDKINSSKLPKVSDVVRRNVSFGTYVPLGDVGGFSKKYIVYHNVICVHNGEVYYYDKEGNIKTELAMKSNLANLTRGKAATAVRMNSLDQAIRWHKAYRDNVLLNGFAGLSLFKGTHFHYDYIYYLPFDKEMTNDEIIQYLNLDGNDIEVLKTNAKTTTLENRYKNEGKKQINKNCF